MCELGLRSFVGSTGADLPCACLKFCMIGFKATNMLGTFDSDALYIEGLLGQGFC